MLFPIVSKSGIVFLVRVCVFVETNPCNPCLSSLPWVLVWSGFPFFSFLFLLAINHTSRPLSPPRAPRWIMNKRNRKKQKSMWEGTLCRDMGRSLLAMLFPKWWLRLAGSFKRCDGFFGGCFTREEDPLVFGVDASRRDRSEGIASVDNKPSHTKWVGGRPSQEGEKLAAEDKEIIMGGQEEREEERRKEEYPPPPRT